MYGHYFSFQIDSRPGGNAMKNAVLAVWRCTLLAGRCFLSFLFFLLLPPDRGTVSFFLLRVSFRNIKRNFLFYSSIIGIKTNFLIHFLISGYLPVSENTLRERSRSVEKRRILHGILYENGFPSESGNKRKTMELNLRPMRKIWKSSNYCARCVRKLGGEGENDRPFGKLAGENESSIGYALHCSWQLVALLAGEGRIRLRWKGTSRGRKRKRKEKGEKKGRTKEKIHALVNARVSIWEQRGRRKKGEQEQRSIDRCDLQKIII